MKESWNLEPVFRQEFIDACELASRDDEAFKNFKTHDRINTVIENTPMWWAEKALAAMGKTPTMIRYDYTIHLIDKLIGWEKIHDIIEIGGGYGGQCEAIFNTTKSCYLNSYFIFDLPEVQALQKRYLQDLRYSIYFSRQDAIFLSIDFVLSWCAWGELNEGAKKNYLDRVISKAKHFLICANYTFDDDLKMLRQVFPDCKTYEDELVEKIIYQ